MEKVTMKEVRHNGKKRKVYVVENGAASTAVSQKKNIIGFFMFAFVSLLILAMVSTPFIVIGKITYDTPAVQNGISNLSNSTEIKAIEDTEK